MFGLKFRTWMESHIVRPRKKRAKEAEKSGKHEVPEPIAEDSKPPQDLRSDMEPISLDVSLEAGNNLSSPESAYSTGYSTDGTSPGHPPEYYINIRTGTHYFLPKPTSPPEVSRPEPSTVRPAEPPKVVGPSPLHAHRRAESCSEPRYSPMPRPRNRIRTNPWLPSNPGTTLHCEVVNIVEDDAQSSTSTSVSTSTSASASTDDDLTLNEMMGKFDESYVYEKETDILSDSDPTDCEETDLETGREGGDEDEEELDFIDKGSLVDLPLGVDGAVNRGHCTYHDFVKKPRYGRNSTRGREAKEHFFKRMGSYRNDPNVRNGSEKKRTRSSVRKRNMQSKLQFETSNTPVVSGEIKREGGLNLNRILMQKVLARGNMAGTRSAGSTPISLRKKVLATERESPNKTMFLNSSFVDDNIHKRRSNSVSNARNNYSCETKMTSFVSELALIEADKEADLKYRELILEAENIITTIKEQIPTNTIRNVIPKPKPFMRNTDFTSDQSPMKEERKLLRKVLTEKNEVHEEEDLLAKWQSERRNSSSPTRRICHSSKQSESIVTKMVHKETELGRKQSFLGEKYNLSNETSLKDKRIYQRSFRDKTGIKVATECNHTIGFDQNKSNHLFGKSFPENTKKMVKSPTMVGMTTRPPLVAFRSVDLGNELGDSNYCPQSEPVKRKVYSCSVTFDRLQKSLNNNQPETGQDNSRNMLREKLRQLRERDEQSSLRQQMLVSTIEGLKRSLQDQSAKLQATYSSKQIL